MPSQDLKPVSRVSDATDRDDLQPDDQGEEAKLDWLRAAIKLGCDQIDRGECIEFESMDALKSYIDQLCEEAIAEVEAGAVARKRD